MASMQDTFADESGDVALTAHTPSPGGTGSWTLIWNGFTGPRYFGVQDSTETAGELGPSAGGTGNGGAATISFTPASAEYDVSVGMRVTATTDAATATGLLARVADIDNLYFCVAYPDNANPDWRLGIISGGTVTDDLDTGNNAPLTDNVRSTITLAVRNTSPRLTVTTDQNGTSLTSDNATITAAGAGGMCIGDIRESGTDYPNTEQALDNFLISDAAASGAIAGTASLALGEAASLTGAGALAGTAALALGQAASLTGAGALAGTAALALGQAASLTGAGALSGTAALALGQATDLTGAGALAGTSSLSVTGSGTLSLPSGAIAGTASLALGVAPTLSGAGALAAVEALAVASAATLTGAGALAATGALVFASAADLTSSSPIAGSASLGFAAAADLKGAGALAATASLALADVAALAGVGALGGLSEIALTASASIIAAGIGVPDQRTVAVGARGSALAVPARPGAIPVTD